MTQLQPLILPDGGTVFVEVEPVNGGRGLRPATNTPEDRATKNFTDMLPSIRSVASSVVDCLQDLPHKPDSIGVEFGLKIGGEVGVILTKGTAEANLKLTLSWKAEKS